MRLRPLTDNFQKCLLPVKGRPILEWWLDAVFRSKCFDNVFVNVHHCADQVENWLYNYLIRKGSMVRIIDERVSLLGTAGTLFWHADTSQDFMVAYTDTFSETFFGMIPACIESFRAIPEESLAGLISFNAPKDSSAGTFVADCVGNVLSFEEKKELSDLAWAGILFGKPKFLSQITDKQKDLARDVLPKMCGKLRVISHVEAYDIGRGIDCYEKFSGTVRKTSQR